MATVEIRVYDGHKQSAKYSLNSSDRKGIKTIVDREKSKSTTSVIWVGTKMVYRKR